MSPITVKNAVKKFKNSTVIDNVSLTLEGGNIYGFVGRNGSGKTMLFRAISGLIHLTSGSIEIDGKVLHKDIDALPSVGIAIENAGLFPDLSGYKNLKLLAGIKKKISKDKIRKTISEVGLDPDDKRPIRKYSLGMRQRPTFTDLISTPPSTIRNTLVGFVKSNKHLSFSYLGLLYTRIALSTLTTLDLIPGGATCFKSVARIVSAATSSSHTIIRSQPVTFAHTVATCPWIKRSSILANTIFIINRLLRHLFRFLLGFYGIFELQLH